MTCERAPLAFVVCTFEFQSPRLLDLPLARHQPNRPSDPTSMSGDKFKIIVYVPVDHAENVREAGTSRALAHRTGFPSRFRFSVFFFFFFSLTRRVQRSPLGRGQ